MLPGCCISGPEVACGGQRQPCCTTCSCLLGRAVELTVAWGDSGSRGAPVAREERSRSLLLPTVTREAPVDCRLADVPPGNRKGWKVFPGNYRPVTLMSVSGLVTEQVILSAVTWHMPPMEGSEAAGMGF